MDRRQQRVTPIDGGGQNSTIGRGTGECGAHDEANTPGGKGPIGNDTAIEVCMLGQRQFSADADNQHTYSQQPCSSNDSPMSTTL